MSSFQCTPMEMTRIIFLHPDLGIGGAERLVVDAALALKTKGYGVHIVTTHHDKNHAFQETINGDISVTVVGNWIPRNICNRFYAAMAYIRMVYAALYVIAFSDFKPDVVFCDIVSVAIPILRLRFKNVIFYCHYPDQLLSSREGRLKTIYRVPLDWLEEVSMGKATCVFVNSRFTLNVVKSTFKRLNVVLDILYPSLNMSFFDSFSDNFLPPSLDFITKDTICFLSINRYERKKNLNLALEAFNELRHMTSQSDWDNLHLIMAGGYDHRVPENVQHLQELQKICSDLKLNEKVTFLTSVTDAHKISLMKVATCLIYTPSNEHFGIVPIEAMYLCRPVVAANSGGPTESIVDGKTGFLCQTTAISFAKAMKRFISDPNLSNKLGAAGRKRVSSKFSFDKFAYKLDRTINALIQKTELDHQF